MGASLDFTFDPKVWQDHIEAYFDKKLVFGAFALQDRTLTAQPGETVNFPYFKSIGAAEEPAASDALSVDDLEDDSFSCTVKEVGKAVGIRKAAYRKSAANKDRIDREVQSQIARVIAEKVDLDLEAEINNSGSGNSTVGYTSADAAAANRMTILNVNTARVTAFGDKADQSVAIIMHSQHHLDLLNDSTAKFLQADASDPFYSVPGFAGRLLGMAVIVSDQVTRESDIASKRAYAAYILKPNPYGFMLAEEMELEQDKDILHREWVFAGTTWYGVKSFHSKISANDKRICKMIVSTNVAA